MRYRRACLTASGEGATNDDDDDDDDDGDGGGEEEEDDDEEGGKKKKKGKGDGTKWLVEDAEGEGEGEAYDPAKKPAEEKAAPKVSTATNPHPYHQFHPHHSPRTAHLSPSPSP